MFLMSTMGYWIILVTYVTLVMMLLNDEKKRAIHVDSRIEDVFFNRIDMTTRITYADFRNTVYLLLFLFSLVPVVNVVGTLYLVWMIAKKD